MPDRGVDACDRFSLLMLIAPLAFAGVDLRDLRFGEAVETAFDSFESIGSVNPEHTASATPLSLGCLDRKACKVVWDFSGRVLSFAIEDDAGVVALETS